MRTQTVVHRMPEPVHSTESLCVVCDTHVDKKRRSATPVRWARPAPGTTRGSSDTGTRPYQSDYPYYPYFAKRGPRDIQRPLGWSKATQPVSFRV